ncbi:MAG: ABC transporter ATP-binding protein [Acidimicrobiales bacterium]
MSPPAMVGANNASKWFGSVVGVSDVSFEIGPGVTALLGPNGAGKSTLLRMLAGLARPSSGSVSILGRDPRTDVAVSRSVGLVPQNEGMFENLTPLEFVAVSARLQHLPEPDVRAATALEVVELDPRDVRLLGSYSKGMRQRVKLAQALVHEPPVLLLDEPLTGLDPHQRHVMIALLHRLGEEGRCVLVSSHVLEEVERIGSRVLVIARGRLAAEGDFRDLRTLMDDRPQRIAVRCDTPRPLAAALVAADVVDGVRIDEDTVTLETSDGAAFARSLPRLVLDTGVNLIEVRPLDDDLESVFRYLVESP